MSSWLLALLASSQLPYELLFANIGPSPGYCCVSFPIIFIGAILGKITWVTTNESKLLSFFWLKSTFFFCVLVSAIAIIVVFACSI